MKRISFVVLALLALLFVPVVRANDIQINPTGPTFQLNNLVWGATGSNGFNNNFFFSPLSNNESVCIYVYNQNPTSSHTFTAAIIVSGNPKSTTPSDGTWQTAAMSSGISAVSFPGIAGGMGVSTAGTSNVAVSLSASSSLSGSPDTSNVVITQTSGACVAGNNFIGSTPQTSNSIEPIQSISDGLSQSFTAGSVAVNPTSSAIMLQVNANGGAHSQYFYQAVIGNLTASAVQLVLFGESDQGSGCTTIVTGNEKVNSTVTTTGRASDGCTTPPTFVNGVGIGAFDVPPNSTLVIDLKGYIDTSGSTNGLVFQYQGTTASGNVNVAVRWYEK